MCTRNANATRCPEILIGSLLIKETDNRQGEVLLTCAMLLLVKIMEKACGGPVVVSVGALFLSPAVQLIANPRPYILL